MDIDDGPGPGRGRGRGRSRGRGRPRSGYGLDALHALAHVAAPLAGGRDRAQIAADARQARLDAREASQAHSEMDGRDARLQEIQRRVLDADARARPGVEVESEVIARNVQQHGWAVACRRLLPHDAKDKSKANLYLNSLENSLLMFPCDSFKNQQGEAAA